MTFGFGLWHFAHFFAVPMCLRICISTGRTRKFSAAWCEFFGLHLSGWSVSRSDGQKQDGDEPSAFWLGAFEPQGAAVTFGYGAGDGQTQPGPSRATVA